MTRGTRVGLVCLLLWTMGSDGGAARRAFPALWAGPAWAAATGAAHPAERRVPAVAWRLDFADYAGGSLEAWLRTKGFRLEHGAEDPAALDLSHRAGAPVLEAKQPVRGFLVNDVIQLTAFSTIRITWGVIKYPAGASYAH